MKTRKLIGLLMAVVLLVSLVPMGRLLRRERTSSVNRPNQTVATLVPRSIAGC